MNEPLFDEVVLVEVDGCTIDLVVHRDANGLAAFWHSPLTIGTVTCEICAKGARVYV